VKNTGTEALKNIIVSDALATDCNKSFSGVVLQPGESTTVYSCTQANTNTGYTNIAKVTAFGTISNSSVDDEDNSTVEITPPALSPSIEITKYSNQGTPDQDGNQDKNQADDNQKIASGATAKFNIVVKNTGNEVLKNIVITDILTPSCNKNLAALKLQPGTSISVYSCEFVNTQTGFVNTATVSAL
jgi:uncharacterized repeat protein (TIGR01451 family)